MTKRSTRVPEELKAAIDDAINDAGLGDTLYGRRVKQLLLNVHTGQYREDDLADILELMPPPYGDESA